MQISCNQWSRNFIESNGCDWPMFLWWLWLHNWRVSLLSAVSHEYGYESSELLKTGNLLTVWLDTLRWRFDIMEPVCLDRPCNLLGVAQFVVKWYVIYLCETVLTSTAQASRYLETAFFVIFFSVLMHDNVFLLETTAFWDAPRCSLVEVHRRFRDAFCLHHQVDSLWCWRQQAPLKSRWSSTRLRGTSSQNNRLHTLYFDVTWRVVETFEPKYQPHLYSFTWLRVEEPDHPSEVPPQ